ncbi:putative PhoD-like phosphatase domain-containing protein [Seiridium cardinale]
MAGPVSAPYWGHLPPTSRRTSEDYSRAHDRRQSLDTPVSTSQSQPRSNRVSVQTQSTDAHTDSTYSPLASPIDATSQGIGLAPRPPTLPYGKNTYPPDLVEKRKRRSARNYEDLSEEARATPPAAPDVPRAPPVSYRDPYGSGRNSPYTFNASGQPGPPPSAHRSVAQAKAAADMDPSAGVPRSAARPFDEDLEARRARRALADNDADPGRTVSTRRPHNGDRSNRVGSHRRRESIDPDVQRQKWADDRSPLQKLELTLDTVTKEEKRARVEAAERRARGKAATAAAEVGVNSAPTTTSADRPAGQQVHFRTRRQSVGQGDVQRPAAADLRREHVPPAPREHLLQGGSGDHRRRNSLGQSPGSHIPVPKNRNVSAPVSAGLPQRNLSFRERAANNDSNGPPGNDGGSPELSPVSAPIGGSGVARSASNKLRKNPPGDPWYSKRTEAEERFPSIRRRGEDVEATHFSGDAGVSRSRSLGGTLKKARPQEQEYERPPGRGKQYDYGDSEELSETPGRVRDKQSDYHGYDEYDEPPSRVRGFAAAIGLGRSASFGAKKQQPPSASRAQPYRENSTVTKSVKFPDERELSSEQVDEGLDEDSHHYFHDYFHKDRSHPGQVVYQPPKYLDEWKKATTGQLTDALLDTQAQVPKSPEGAADHDTAWWESSGKRKGSMSSRPPKAEAFDGEYDETQGPTRFKPALYLKCGPLLRYCGIRHERTATRSRNGAALEKEIWRGSVMIVTEDSQSDYDIAPTLRLFVQPIDLLPPPPAELKGEQPLLPEYVDPIAGIPKLGRWGESLYVRPVEHLEEGKDLSMLDADDGLFETTRTAPDFSDATDAPGSFASRRKRSKADGEKLGKYKDVRGFRLHCEKGCTFWRFNIEIELRDKQQRIAYRINRGPSTGFWVPARGQSMNIMFHSCNGFSLSVKSDDLSGPDPMWRDVLNTHQTQPFHVMIGGGDQIYNDAVMRQTTIFKQWLEIKNPLHKHNAPFTAELQEELEVFYLGRYCMWFSQGLFGLANSQIPMVNMYDDHDIIDGFGSYPDHFMKSPVFSGLGAVAFKYYMLFQQQSIITENEEAEPSWVLGCQPGPYIRELSRSLYMSLGSGLALLAVDARTERTRDEVLQEDTWRKIIDRCYAEIVKGETTHLLVLLGVPIAYPRLVWLENILTSRLMDPVKALGKAGLLGNFLNRFDGGVEVLDDLDDHWTAKNHKDERKVVIEDLQDLAADKSVRITILSGDVHLAAIGQFYSNPKLHVPKHKDFRYMPNIISSAIVNTPPPDMMADVLNKRNKIHHFDKETDEDMIPIFTTGVDGKARNNKRLLPHRNWCQIRPYVPGNTPPSTPEPEEREYTPEGTPPEKRGGLLRRLSSSKQRGPTYRPDVPDEQDRSRPPISGGGGVFRAFSRRGSTSEADKRPGKLLRTLSLGRGDSVGSKKGGFFSRKPSDRRRRPDDGGINGDWGADSDEEFYDATPPPQQTRRTRPTAFEGPDGQRGDKLARMGLRGGAGNAREAAEYDVGDDSYFSVTTRVPQRSYTQPIPSHGHGSDWTPDEPFRPKPFHRTPTGLSVKQLKKAERWQVDVEGALDIQLNVEVNPKDPAGITVPYRLLVPKLEYEYQGEDASIASPEIENGNAGIEEEPPEPKRNGTLKRLFSGRGKGSQYREHRGGEDAEYEYDRGWVSRPDHV